MEGSSRIPCRCAPWGGVVRHGGLV